VDSRHIFVCVSNTKAEIAEPPHALERPIEAELQWSVAGVRPVMRKRSPSEELVDAKHE
jgi:hypothetical protein